MSNEPPVYEADCETGKVTRRPPEQGELDSRAADVPPMPEAMPAQAVADAQP
jgi:hypothetical protein